MAGRHPRDARVEGIEQRRFPLAFRLRDAHVERRAHHETLDLRLHDPVRAARTRQAQLVATLRAHFASALDIVTIRWRSCRGWRLLDGDELDIEYECSDRERTTQFHSSGSYHLPLCELDRPQSWVIACHPFDAAQGRRSRAEGADTPRRIPNRLMTIAPSACRRSLREIVRDKQDFTV